MDERADGFGNVDGAPRPRAYVDYLDRVDALPGTAAYKRKSYELLEVGRGDRVLDVGCGTGTDVMHVASLLGTPGLAVGVDVSRTMVAEAQRRHGHPASLRFCVSHAERLPFAAGSFSALRIDRVLHHLTDPHAAVTEAARVVVGGGRVVLTEPDLTSVRFSEVDDEVSQLARRVICGGCQHPDIGARLDDLCDPEIFGAVHREEMSLRHDDLAEADALLDLQGVLRRVAFLGLVSVDEVTRWWEDRLSAWRDGRFLCTLRATALQARVNQDSSRTAEGGGILKSSTSHSQSPRR